MKKVVLLLIFAGLISCSKAQYQEKYSPTVQELKQAVDEIVQKNMGKSSTGILDIKDEEILTVFYTYCKAIESNPEEIKIYKKVFIKNWLFPTKTRRILMKDGTLLRYWVISPVGSKIDFHTILEEY
ncbi:MAG: hypothetical protein AUK34_04775 [Ignavibacteria bacterium CG2_30_36_16]|nr:MAG: hypothetical protein AUK34_04775 [Ignavibacteria bacterium CG2_30_36_16]